MLSFSQGSDEAVDKVEGGGEGEVATPAAKVTSNFDYNQEISIGEIRIHYV